MQYFTKNHSKKLLKDSELTSFVIGSLSNFSGKCSGCHLSAAGGYLKSGLSFKNSLISYSFASLSIFSLIECLNASLNSKSLVITAVKLSKTFTISPSWWLIALRTDLGS